jgi:hypothetical protein
MGQVHQQHQVASGMINFMKGRFWALTVGVGEMEGASVGLGVGCRAEDAQLQDFTALIQPRGVHSIASPLSVQPMVMA